MNVQLTLAIRYLKGRKLRTALTTLAIVFGVMLLFGLNGILPAMLQSLQSSMVAATGQTDLVVTSKSTGQFDASVAATVAGVDGVAAATPMLRVPVALQPKKYPVGTISLIGVDPDSAVSVRPYPVTSGRFLTADDLAADRVWTGSGRNPSVTLPDSTAKSLGLGVGDTLEIPSAFGVTKLEVVGTLDILTVPGNDEAYVSLPAAQAMLDTGNRISEVDAAIKAGSDRPTVTAAAQKAVGDAYLTGGVEANSSLFASLKLGSFIINMFGVFAIVMAGFIILNTFRTVVAERRHDIGMLRAIGASQRTIFGMFLTESLVQGVLGTAIGIVVGYGLSSAALSGLSSIYSDLLHLSVGKPVFLPSTWILAIGMGVGVTVLSALIPARAAARITPLEAMRPQMGDVYEKVVTRRAWIGAAIIAAAVAGLVSRNTSLVGFSSVVFLVGLALVTPALVKPVTDAFGRAIDLGFRQEGALARANLQRNAGRAAVTASAMMVSVAVVIALLGTFTSVFDGFISYIDKAMGADFLVIPSNMLLSTGTVGANDALLREVKATEGVGDVATLRVGRAAMGSTSLQVIGIDPVAYQKVASFEFSDGSSQADLAKLGTDSTIMVNGIFAAQNGLAKGEKLKLETPAGTKTYTIAAVGSDYLNAKLATAYVSQSELERDFGVTADVVIMANAKSGADKAASLASLKSTVKDFPQFALYDTKEWRDLQVGTFQQVYGAMYFMLFVLAVPSLLALLNTLAIGVLARTREIGMLRAIGSTRKQVRRMVIAESLLLASLGTVLGMLAGVWLGYSMVDAMNTVGFKMPYYFPYNGLAIALVIGITFGVVAALIPARQATKLDIVAALHYE
ncbi:MAG: FtsX-like permease family protein [Actinomycetota bacterium]|nr:FtsX-like permease family protein [Actinomycetota bacterium]